VFSCKGRPFTSLVSKEISMPTSTLIDYELVRDLNIKMTDLQCQKFTFAGFKMRILGQICTAVQCVKDGFVAGSFQLSATVVLDLAKNLDTFSVAGKKLASLLSPSTTMSPASPKTPAKPSATASPTRATTPAQGTPMPSSPQSRATRSAQQGRPSPSPPPPSKRATTSAHGRPSPTLTSPPPSKMTPSTPDPVPHASSPPSTISYVSVRPLSSPPGFPTPMFVNKTACAEPVCLSVRAVNLQRSPLSTNLEYFDETFQGADKMTNRDEKQTLRNHFKDAEFEDLQNGSFIMKTKLGLRYWSGHGEYKCTPNCFQLYGNGPKGVPNNCGFHQQWLFPEGFKPCGPRCNGAFCTCL